jgi:hypothetical protein
MTVLRTTGGCGVGCGARRERWDGNSRAGFSNAEIGFDDSALSSLYAGNGCRAGFHRAAERRTNTQSRKRHDAQMSQRLLQLLPGVYTNGWRNYLDRRKSPPKRISPARMR